MEISQFRRFLLERGMVYFYAIFMAGYFLLPMASGHRRLYYLLVLPAVLVLWRELQRFYRGNALFLLIAAYAGYMMLSLTWTENFTLKDASQALWNSINLLSFIAISGYIWIQYPQRIDRLTHAAVWLAAAAALVSTVVWYWQNPFPASRLEPLGVMHHQNKSGAAYGAFLVLCVYYLASDRGRENRLPYLLLAGILASLVLLTQSRTALAGTCVGIVVLLGWRAMGAALLGLAASWALLASNPESWSHRVEALSFRPGIWQQVLLDWQDKWLIGRGYLVDPRVPAYDQLFDHAHNSYLATLRDGGVLGLLLMLAMLATALLWSTRLLLQNGERLYLALLLMGMTYIFMDFDRLLVHPKEMWLYLWLPIALIAGSYPHRDDPGLRRYTMTRDYQRG